MTLNPRPSSTHYTWAGVAVAVSDRLDTLAGLFAAVGAPKSTADPFGLRRAAYGLVQALVGRDNNDPRDSLIPLLFFKGREGGRGVLQQKRGKSSATSLGAGGGRAQAGPARGAHRRRGGTARGKAAQP